MGIFASYKKKDYPLAPEGHWAAVCCDVIDKGMVSVVFQGIVKQQHKVVLLWELEEKDSKTDLPFIVSKRYTLSLSDRANLRKDLKAWRSRDFTPAELEKFDVESVIGANCGLTITHNIKDEGQSYANVVAIVPPRKGTPKLKISSGYVRVKDRKHEENGNGDHEPGEDADENMPF